MCNIRDICVPRKINFISMIYIYIYINNCYFLEFCFTFELYPIIVKDFLFSFANGH